MSRLIDRLLATPCQPLRMSALDPAGWRQQVRDAIVQNLSERGEPAPSDTELDALTTFATNSGPEPAGVNHATPSDFSDVPVFAADEVARYCALLPDGTDITDVVSTMAPPYPKFFVEFQHVSDRLGLGWNAWGWLVTSVNPAATQHPDGDVPHWLLRAEMIGEPTKKHAPMGPVVEYLIGLDTEGLWLRHRDGRPYFGGSLTPQQPAPPPDAQAEAEETAQRWADHLVRLLLPALLAISFTHANNVTVRTQTPPPKLSKRWAKRRGRPLCRYHTLDIEPLRKVLDHHRRSDTDPSLARALHLARGHFKTYTPEAPLFGKVTGRWWWGPQVRGSGRAGVVEKDYRVRLTRRDQPSEREEDPGGG